MVGFFAFARFFLALAGLDIGTAFGGMGSSREMTISSLAEPAMLMAVFTLTMTASTTNLSGAIAHVVNEGMVLRPSFVFALFALILVAIAETGRVPVDNPATHLELTMIHEAMILEYSGRHLALIEWASQLKLMLYGVLIANIFFPWGIAETFTAEALGYGLLAIMGKLALLAIFLAYSRDPGCKNALISCTGISEFCLFVRAAGYVESYHFGGIKLMNIEQPDFYTQAILSMAALVGLTSFLMLGQGRLLRLIFVFALQGFLLTLTTALAAYSLNNPHLYISAILTLVLKVIFIPWMLRREVMHTNMHHGIFRR